MTRYVIFTIALGALLLLPGCALFDQKQLPMAVDTFCLTAKKRSWSIHDTPESIRDARVWNQVVDRRCGASKGSAA